MLKTKLTAQTSITKISNEMGARFNYFKLCLILCCVKIPGIANLNGCLNK